MSGSKGNEAMDSSIKNSGEVSGLHGKGFAAGTTSINWPTMDC